MIIVSTVSHWVHQLPFPILFSEGRKKIFLWYWGKCPKGPEFKSLSYLSLKSEFHSSVFWQASNGRVVSRLWSHNWIQSHCHSVITKLFWTFSPGQELRWWETGQRGDRKQHHRVRLSLKAFISSYFTAQERCPHMPCTASAGCSTNHTSFSTHSFVFLFLALLKMRS